MAGYTIRKYMSPWIIETPPEYSLLFLPPVNRLEIPIVPLVGLVDSDTYHNNVNTPFIHTMLEPNKEVHTIPKGTPICQVVPVKRDEWKAEYTFLDKEQLDKQKELRKTIQEDRLDWYKNHAHTKNDMINKILITGIPGSGKTTLAKPLAELLGAIHLSADNIRLLYHDWILVWKVG